jgi:transcription initiation factor IIE alpha subunit
MEHCPVCQARIRNYETCPRCKAELKTVIQSERIAKHWLAEAIHNLQNNEIESAINALEKSLRLNTTSLGMLVRQFLIYQQIRRILQLLKQKNLLAAKNQMYLIRYLVPYSPQLKQLRDFLDYLQTRQSFINH